jgi:hypothetical protein
MGEQIDLSGLRELIDKTVVAPYEMFRHDDIPALCESLGMPKPPPRRDPRTGEEITKHERLKASLGACRNENLPPSRAPSWPARNSARITATLCRTCSGRAPAT